jgi:hypothetical protein
METAPCCTRIEASEIAGIHAKSITSKFHACIPAAHASLLHARFTLLCRRAPPCCMCASLLPVSAPILKETRTKPHPTMHNKLCYPSLLTQALGGGPTKPLNIHYAWQGRVVPCLLCSPASLTVFQAEIPCLRPATSCCTAYCSLWTRDRLGKATSTFLEIPRKARITRTTGASIQRRPDAPKIAKNNQFDA